MTSIRLFTSAARIAFLSLPEAGSWLLTLVRVVFVPVASGLFYLAMSSGGTGELTPANGLTAAAAVGALTASMAAASLLASDRFEGTIALLVIAPRSHGMMWAGRLTVVLGLGLATSLVTAIVTLFLTGAAFSFGELGAALLALCAATLSSIGVGQFIGALSLRMKDAFLLPNFSEFALPILCGVVAPIAVFPSALQWVASIFPLTHVTQAIRALAHTGITQTFWLALLLAVGVGVVWLAGAVAAWKVFQGRARATGDLEALSV